MSHKQQLSSTDSAKPVSVVVERRTKRKNRKKRKKRGRGRGGEVKIGGVEVRKSGDVNVDRKEEMSWRKRRTWRKKNGRGME